MSIRRESDKRYDAKRSKQQSAKGTLWAKQHPEVARARMRKAYELNKGNKGIYAEMLEDNRDPIEIESDAIFICPDWHIPFHDNVMKDLLYDIAETYGIHDIAIPGDFFDCDNYTTYLRYSYMETFKQELEAVSKVLDELQLRFGRIFFCRGNHEKRWISLNYGHMGMQELFKLVGAGDKVEVTQDDFMILNPHDNPWMLCHPRNYRQTPLSVARDLATKYHKNIISAHGHFFDQGVDKSGKYHCLDGGGIFDPLAFEYLRDTGCTPWVRSGFYLIEGNNYTPYDLGVEE